MSELIIEYDFSLQHCPTCSVPFMLPELDLKNRRATGGSFWCPSGHEIKVTPEGRLADLQWQLEQALGVAADEQARRTDVERELQRILDDAEASGEIDVQVEAKPLPSAAQDQPVSGSEIASKVCAECPNVFTRTDDMSAGSWARKKFCSQACQQRAASRAFKKRQAIKKTETQESSGLGVPPAKTEKPQPKKLERLEPQRDLSTQEASS